MKDFQRQRLYNFQSEHIFPHFAQFAKGKPPFTLDECDLLVQIAYAHMGLDPAYRPDVRPGKRHRRPVCYSDSVIQLPLRARTLPIVVHEGVHAILFRHGNYSAHGEEFCRVYFHLLGKMAPSRMNEKHLAEQARDFGLKVAPQSVISNMRKRRNALEKLLLLSA